VVTYERSEHLHRCLTSLASQDDAVDQVVVVDASAVHRRPDVAEGWTDLRYVHAPALAGWMTRSRNEALRWASGDLIAFLDDDVVATTGWSRELKRAFADPDVSAVAGRTRNGIPGEEAYERPVGRLLPDGSLTDGFASIQHGYVPVDHGIGANMAFRRSVLAELGGFRDDYPGTALREDTDIYLRVQAVGGRAVFAPDAVVDHLPAPHVRGARFDTRYKLYGRRNHVVLLARNRGIGSPLLPRWVKRELAAVRDADGATARVKRLAAVLVGIGWGAAALPRSARWRPLDPRRTDRAGNALRTALERRA
jgi:GT2 family glycosyltransferase